jgi:glucan biosynthesis protein
MAVVTSLPARRRAGAAQPVAGSANAAAFTAADVQKYARELATKPFVPVKIDLPKAWQQLS